MNKPKHHIFICNSFRIGGEPQGVCNKKGAPGFLQYVEEGILDLMRIYVERAKGTPGQKMIKEKVKEYVYGGEVQAGLSPREMEKIFLNKTEEDIEAARLDK